MAFSWVMEVVTQPPPPMAGKKLLGYEGSFMYDFMGYSQ